MFQTNFVETMKTELFQITNSMHNSFILQQYICYITINMFRAARCSSSGGQIVSPHPLVSSPSVNSRTTCRSFTESDDTRWCNDTILSSWRWARYCSKRVEDYNV